jgi:hypothetical protein
MNFDKYTDEMRKSIWDKAFFMDKIIGAKCIIDFGCADGTLICMLADMFPDMKFYGYDHLPEMINRAKVNTRPNTFFYNSWEFKDMCAHVKAAFDSNEICLNFSSVLHEVFSSSPSGKTNIEYMVKELQPKYITIRDMYYDGNNHYLKWSRVNEIINMMNIRHDYIDDFERFHGSIVNEGGMLHFLMKYQWKDNGWEQELDEDYFSWNLTMLLALIGQYEKLFEAHYLLPYYAEKWKDIDIDPVHYHTHAQFILRRKD